MVLEPGRMVTANVRLVRLIGKGGMGSVWLADHLALGSQVAVKFMAAAYVDTPNLVTRFAREATLAAQIKSPHVVQILDHGVLPEGVPFIVMELLRGEDLARRLKLEGPLPPAEVARIVFQVAKALAKAHHVGILHRDIKPDNIFLLQEEGEVFVKVLDFGVAKRIDDGSPTMTATGSTVGTPFYMSPEQLFSAKHVDVQCDLWSLSVVAYRALTGQLPFRGDTLGAVSLAVHSALFVPPSALRPELPPAADAWFAKALCRDPRKRFGSVKELAESFAREVVPPDQNTLAGVDFPSFPTFVPHAAIAPGRALEPLSPPLAEPAPPSAPPPSLARPSRPPLPVIAASSLLLVGLGGAIAFFTTRPGASKANAGELPAAQASALPSPAEATSRVDAPIPSAAPAIVETAAASASAAPVKPAPAIVPLPNKPPPPKRKARDRGF